MVGEMAGGMVERLAGPLDLKMAVLSVVMLAVLWVVVLEY